MRTCYLRLFAVPVSCLQIVVLVSRIVRQAATTYKYYVGDTGCRSASGHYYGVHHTNNSCLAYFWTIQDSPPPSNVPDPFNATVTSASPV